MKRAEVEFSDALYQQVERLAARLHGAFRSPVEDWRLLAHEVAD